MNTITFDLGSAEQSKWLARFISDLQGQGVKFILEKDANLIYLTIK